MDALQRIKDQVENNAVIIYMKGTPQLRNADFQVVRYKHYNNVGAKFAYVNVLLDPEIFQHLPQYANWPTFPQVYVSGELIGGCDIVLEMHERGELQKAVDNAQVKTKQ